MKTRTIIFLSVALLLLGITAVVHRSVQSRIGPQHIFELSEQPQFLTDQLALAKARETLTRDGYDVSVWQPTRDGRTTAPSGRPDEFLTRNTVTPNRGVIMFTSTTASPRFVSVELDGSRVVCQTSIAK